MAYSKAALAFFALLLGSPAVQATDTPHSAGLIMHLDASTGVHAANGVVTHWWDQSGFGQNLIAKGLPRVILDGLNGRSVIQLAGEGDGFSQSGPSGLPIYENDRTLLVLSAPAQTSGSIGWGAVQGCKQSFAVHHDRQSNSAVSTGCTEDLMHTQKRTCSWAVAIECAACEEWGSLPLTRRQSGRCQNRTSNDKIGPLHCEH